MKHRLVLFLLAGSLIMNGSGMQADIGKPVEAAEKDVGEEQTESVGGVGNVNLEESADSEESAD